MVITILIDKDFMDYDIVQLDSIIKKHHKSEIEKDIYDKELRKLKWINENTPIPFEKDNSLKMIDAITIYIERTKTKLNEYSEKTSPILESYVNYKSSKSIFILGKKNNIVTDTSTKRINIILNYLNIAKFFYDINIIMSSNNTVSQSNSDDSSHNKQKVEKYYNRNKIFVELLYIILGKNTDIPSDVYVKIDKSINLYNINPKTINKKTIYMLLDENKLKNYRDYVNVIHVHYTGIKLPDVSDLIIERIIEKYKMIDDMYNLIKPKNRVKSLNNYYILNFLLKKEKIKIEMDDKEILRTTNTEQEYTTIMQKICSELQNKNPDQDWSFK